MNTEISMLEYFAYAYLTLVIVKTLLFYGNVDAVFAVYYRKRGDHYPLFRVATALVLIPVITFCMLPVLLRDEGFKFFFVYSKRKAMRDLLSGL